MLRQMYNHLRIDSMNDAGKLAAYFNLPIEKRKYLRVPCLIAKIILYFLIKYAYVGLFMFLPYMILSAKLSTRAFPFVNCMVYFSVNLSAICGSLINSSIFDVDDDAYPLLVTLRFRPDSFFIGRILLKLIGDFIGFTTAFMIFEMSFGRALYLALWILVGRVIGEIINIYVYRIIGRSIHEMHALSTVIMLLSVFMAYGFPYLRGHVVDLTGYVYNYVWLGMGLLVAATVIYGLFIYDGYGVVARKFSKSISTEHDEDVERSKEEIDFLMADLAVGKNFKMYDKDTTRGSEYLHKVFFARNKQYINNAIFVRSLLILAVTVVGVIVCLLSGFEAKEVIWLLELHSLPLMVFIMFCLSAAPAYIKAAFFHMDRRMISSKGFSTGVNNYRNFNIRVRKLIGLDLILAMFLCVGLTFIGYSTGHSEDINSLFGVYLGIILLAVFYPIFYLGIYYLLQPYTFDMKVKNHGYVAAHVIMLAIAYGCIYVNISTTAFNIILGLVVCAAYSVAISLVFYKSKETFKVRG